MPLSDLFFHLYFFHKEKIFFLRMTAGIKKTSMPLHADFGVNIGGYLTTESGVGEAARGLIRGLGGTQIPFVVNNIEQKWLRSEDKSFSHLIRKENPYAINILNVNADMVPYVANRLGRKWFDGKYTIGYWFWELPDFPAEWKVSFRCFDEIWVGSDFCKNSISKVSPIPVTKIQPAVEVKVVRDYDRGFFGLSKDSFVFLYAFDFMSCYERKNPIAIISAFKKAFNTSACDAPVLVLKLHNTHKNKEAYNRILRSAEGIPVKIIDRYLTKGELYGLMSVSDCYVSLHRAEGFGLPLAEAMYLGKPVIATGYSGNMEFMDDQNSLPVKFQMKIIENTIGNYRKGNYWADPDIEHAAQLMTLVFENKEKAKEIGCRASAHMKRNFSPEATGKRLEEELRKRFDKCGVMIQHAI